MGFWKDAFSDAGSPSASRVLSALTTLTSCSIAGYVAYHTHAAPDAVTMTGLAAFSTAPYALNAAKNTITAFSGQAQPKT